MHQEVEIQRQYYASTASSYDEMHLEKDQEHFLALHLLASYINFYQIRSVLDVGAGTGRTFLWLKNRFPDLVVKGIEPVAALREQGYKKGIPPEDLIDGDAYHLPFPENSFDLVCEFAVLHHVREPEKMIREMSRVASKMVSISDCNFMGQGSLPLRFLKYTIFSLGFWSVANWIKTKGKGYTISEDDGLAYSYSVYQSLRTIQKSWKTLRMTSTKGESDTWFGSIVSTEQLLLIALNKKSSY
ncbi:MAG: class I SAM-dependent methyltransferase [Coleofasciculus sp. C1-SOL-03]|uniref:class I SAM-dependent methyltransferase n=1 Tax=Coleofasciculus sp. C1-SOL-03 TaxID=3069522 RepID=UPI003301F5CC